jgi:hypothetical protein
MSVMISFSGTPAQILGEMQEILRANASIPAPAVSDASSDKEPRGASADISKAREVVADGVVVKSNRRKTKAPQVTDVVEPAPVEPTPPADSFPNPADAIQDAADEYAEDVGPVGLDGAIIYTLDDVRNSALPYITKWGKEAAAKDLVPIVMAAGGVPNIGKLDPANQELLKKVMQAFADAAEADKRFEA